MYFAENLRVYRERMKLSRKEIAALLSISIQAYGHYENGEREPKLEMLVKIATTLHVSIDDLLGYKVDTYEHYKAVFLDLCPAYGIREQGDMVAIYSKEQEKANAAPPLTWEQAWKLEFDFEDGPDAPHEAFDFLPMEWTPDAPPYYLPLELKRADFITIMQRAADDWKKETRNQYANQIYKRLGMYKRYHTHKGEDAKKPADDTAGKKEG